MATFIEVRPFSDDPLDEIPLSDPPIVAVIAQVRFPPVAAVSNQEFIAAFQESIRLKYPVLRPEHEVRFALSPTGVVQAPPSDVIWRFTDLEQNWRLSLAPSFLALDVGEYKSREDFISRFREAIDALATYVGPVVYDRLGVRYVDRVEITEQLPPLEELVRPEVLGIGRSDLGGSVAAARSIVDNEFQINGTVLHARWGTIPPGATLDIAHGGPGDHPSWLLDLDMYTAPQDRLAAFDVAEVALRAERFAESIYRVFRWAVSEEFLKHFGANR